MNYITMNYIDIHFLKIDTNQVFIYWDIIKP